MDTKKIKEIASKGHSMSDVASMELVEAYAETQGRPGSKKYNRIINYFYEEVAIYDLILHNHSFEIKS